MRFTKKRYPILSYIENNAFQYTKGFGNALSEAPFSEKVQAKKRLPRLKNVCSNNIYYLALPIAKRLLSDADLQNKLIPLLSEINDESGVLLLPPIGSKFITFYAFDIKNKNGNIFYNVALGGGNGISMLIYGKFEKGSSDTNARAVIDDRLVIDDKDYIASFTLIGQLLLTLLFKQYAEIETKIIEGGVSRVKDGIGKVKNDSKIPIEVINSNWFTNIVRKEGFNVKGHFRLQAYGTGMKERRLQWISGFKKHGYTRKAKINKK